MVLKRTLLALTLICLICPSHLFAASERRTALVIGNSAYTSGPLKNPVNDATDMSAMLLNMGFSVTIKKNADLQTMEEAIEEFGNSLKKGGVGLFYYAGHGVQVNGVNYLIPIGAQISKESDVKYRAVDVNKILDEMSAANNGLNIVMLDACRDNPFARSFRSAARGLAIISSAPSGTFISYSTSPGTLARDGSGRNSPYTSALLQYMQAPGISINDVFIRVRSKVKKETGQVPWELSSLEGQFYFLPSEGEKPVKQIQTARVEPESSEPVGGKNQYFRVIELPGGDRYEGEFRDNAFNGKGTLVYANGNRYKGGFLNGKRNGHGTMLYANDDRYDGEFRDDKFNGQGIYVHANGDRFEGEYRDDKRNGKGILTYKDGRVLKGVWKNSEYQIDGGFQVQDQDYKEFHQRHIGGR